MESEGKSVHPKEKNVNPNNAECGNIIEIRVRDRSTNESWSRSTNIPFEAVVNKMNSLKKSDFE